MKVRSQNSNSREALGRARQVDVNTLTVGMRIVGIEKPWSDHPQQNTGFTITGTAELDDLRSKHKTVYIESASCPGARTDDARRPTLDATGEDRPIVLWESSESDDEGDASVWAKIRQVARKLNPTNR